MRRIASWRESSGLVTGTYDRSDSAATSDGTLDEVLAQLGSGRAAGGSGLWRYGRGKVSQGQSEIAWQASQENSWPPEAM